MGQARRIAIHLPGTDTMTKVAAALLLATASLRLFLPPLLRPDLASDDLAQHVWWMYRFSDPGAFPGDRLADFFSLPLFVPLGYQLLFRLAVPFVDPQTFAEILPFLLAVPLGVLCFRLGRLSAGGRLLGALLGTAAAIELLRGLSGGHPRSFALPILLLGVWGVMARRDIAIGIAILAGALFYPPIAANVMGVAAIVYLLRWRDERSLPHPWPVVAGLAVAGVAVLMAIYLWPRPEWIGPLVSEAHARANPAFLPGGRSAFFTGDEAEYWIAGRRSGFGVDLLPFSAAALLIGLVAVRARSAVPVAAWALLASALGLFATAHAVLPRLHYPNRYVAYALPVFGLVFLTSVLAGPARRFGWKLGPAARGAAAAAAGVALFLIAWDIPSHLQARFRRPVDLDREAAFEYLSTLPQDALIAAHPEDADPIPLRTRHSVLASMETSLPYREGYYRLVARRTTDVLAATFATSFEDVEALHEEYGVDVFLVNARRYDGVGDFYFRPWSEMSRRLHQRGRSRGFALLEPPRDRLLFQRGAWRVVRLGPKPLRTTPAHHALR